VKEKILKTMNDECERFPCERNKKLYFFCGLYLLKLSFVIIILQKLLLKIGGSKT
jgi:Zn-finger protein